MSTIINLKCLDQTLTLTSTPLIASGGVKEDKVIATFCDKWTGFEKACVFYKDEEHVYYSIFADDECEIPYEVLREEGNLYIGVFGVSGSVIRTTEIVKYVIVKGSMTEGTQPEDPSPDIYAQLLSRMATLEGRIASMYKYKGSVQTYADLPTNALTGDVWNVIQTGMNYAWTGTVWDALGGDIDLSDYYNKQQIDLKETALTTLINGKASAVHTHTKSEITDFAHTHDDRYYTESETDTLLGAKADTAHTHTKSNITDFSHTHTKSDVTDFSHTHTKNDITDFSHTHTKSEVTDFSHTHTKSDVTDFAHTHTKSEVTDFAHNHTKSDITDFAHNHDDRYYTESETDDLLATKAGLTENNTFTGSNAFSGATSMSNATQIGTSNSEYVEVSKVLYDNSTGLQGGASMSLDVSNYDYIKVYEFHYSMIWEYEIPLGIPTTAFAYNQSMWTSSHRYRGGTSGFLMSSSAPETHFAHSAVSADKKTFYHVYTGYYKTWSAVVNRNSNANYKVIKIVGYRKLKVS